MRKKAAAPKIVLTKEDAVLTSFLTDLRELDAEGGPHCCRVDRAELERYLAQLGALECPMGGRCRSAEYLKGLEAPHIGKEGEGPPREKGRVLEALGKPSGQPRRQGDPPAGPRKVGSRKNPRMGRE